MRIVLKEIKKIFSWKMCLALFLISYLIYHFFIQFYIEVFPNGSAKYTYDITAKMVEDYGQEMDEEEFEDFKNLYPEKIKQADKFIQSNEGFKRFGINSYEDYVKANSGKGGSSDKEFRDFDWSILKSEEGTVFWEIQSMESLIGQYQQEYTNKPMYKSDDEQKRIESIVENKENTSIIDIQVLDNYNGLIIGVNICIIVGIIFMLTPVFLKDKIDKLEYIQYTSKCGRSLFKSKLIAGFIVAMIIANLELLICFMLYRSNNTSIFFNSNINSCFNKPYWVSMTFIQYIILTVIFTYVISIITTFISLFISSKAGSYIKGIGIQVVTMFIMVQLTSHLLMNDLNVIYKSKYLVPALYLGLIVLTIGTMIFSIKREKTRRIIC